MADVNPMAVVGDFVSITPWGKAADSGRINRLNISAMEWLGSSTKFKLYMQDSNEPALVAGDMFDELVRIFPTVGVRSFGAFSCAGSDAYLFLSRNWLQAFDEAGATRSTAVMTSDLRFEVDGTPAECVTALFVDITARPTAKPAPETETEHEPSPVAQAAAATSWPDPPESEPEPESEHEPEHRHKRSHHRKGE